MSYNKYLDVGEFDIEYVLENYVIYSEKCDLDIEYNPQIKIKNINKRKLRRMMDKSEIGSDGIEYKIMPNSDRYILFKEKGLVCPICGLKATKAILMKERNGNKRAHFEFYGEKDGELILFSKDHIFPKSKGGLDIQENYQPMCQPCNGTKGDIVECEIEKYDISPLIDYLNKEKDKTTNVKRKRIIKKLLSTVGKLECKYSSEGIIDYFETYKKGFKVCNDETKTTQRFVMIDEMVNIIKGNN